MQFGQRKREKDIGFFQAGILKQKKKLTALNKNKIYHHIMTVNESNHYK